MACEHLAQLVGALAHEELVARDAGCVHDAVEAAAAILDLADQGRNGRGIRDVEAAIDDGRIKLRKPRLYLL